MSTPAPTSKNATRQRDDALTERQHLVLDAIRKHIAEQGFAPSFREIGEAVGLKSPSSVKHQLHALERKGYLHISANKGRAIELYDSGTDSQTATVLPFPGDTEASESILASRDVPLVGRIAAGVPITAEQHIDDVMRLPQRLTGSGKLFMLEVHGDSMIDAAICDGDYVVIREQPSAVNGDIVAALLDDEATIKTFRKDNGHIWLIPHNPAYSPIDGTHAQIMGKVVSVLRRLCPQPTVPDLATQYTRGSIRRMGWVIARFQAITQPIVVSSRAMRRPIQECSCSALGERYPCGSSWNVVWGIETGKCSRRQSCSWLSTFAA